MKTTIKPIKVSRWLEENKTAFLPPICNKMMYNDQLKVFYVAGPNERSDYHIEEGEEFFYMLKGSMCLKVLERGVHKSIVIKEGEAFLLPARIPHSPQRMANTMGLVIEREREEDELDGLRYYVDGTKQVLYERWFHCTDLGSQLAPIIKEYFSSREYKTGIPTANSKLIETPFADDTSTTLVEPICLSEWLKYYEEEIEVLGRKALFEESRFVTSVAIYGGDAMQHYIENDRYETFFWQMTKQAILEIENKKMNFENGSSLVVPPKSKVCLRTQSGGYTLILSMPVKYLDFED